MSRTQVNGGRNAARGFQYQYLRTVEAMLDAIDAGDVDVCNVEGSPMTTSQLDDAVDYNLMGTGGRLILAAQVKSRSANNELNVSEAMTVLIRLAKNSDASQYLLITNSTLTPGVADLNQVLASAGSLRTTEGKSRLGELFRPGQPIREDINQLTDEDWRRLARARVEIDSRTLDNVREAIMNKLRHRRRMAGIGTDAASAGLLLGYLLAETMRRAAHESEAAWRVAEFQDDLKLGEGKLISALGTRDWGTIVGRVPAYPLVDRPAALTKLTALVDAEVPRGVDVPRVVITGMSGIGKSSLAALYVRETAFRYDAIFWIDAGTEESVIESMRRLLSRLDRRSGFKSTVHVSPADLAAGVAGYLRDTNLTWLGVFDNVTDRELLHRWVPQLSRGRVVITTTLPPAHFREAEPLVLEAMERSESVELLMRRMHEVTSDRAFDPHLIEQLAEGMLDWPLAMEIAAGYMRTCGLQLGDVPTYLEQLKLKSLGDQLSVPTGYPRTLVAAVRLAVDRLHSEVSFDPRLQRVTNQALASIPYMASRSIPVHLLATLTADDRGREPLLADPSIVPLLEMARALMASALVRTDDDLPEVQGGPSAVQQLQTLQVNSLVQEVLRESQDSYDDVGALINNLADHVERWLTSAYQSGLSERTSTLAPHAAVLASHVTRLGVASKSTALLLGNTAAIHQARGNLAAAEALLRAEIETLSAIEKDETSIYLTLQARRDLATVLMNDPSSNDSKQEEALGLLERVYHQVQELAVEKGGQESAATFAVFLRVALRAWPVRASIQRRAESLRQVLGELVGRLPSSPTGEAYVLIESMEGALGEGEPVDQRTLGRWITLYGEGLPVDVNVEGWRLVAESMCVSEEWESVTEVVAQMSELLGVPPSHLEPAKRLITNTGLCAAVKGLTDDNNEGPRAVLAQLVRTKMFSWLRDNVIDEYAERFQILLDCHSLFASNSATLSPVALEQLLQQQVTDVEDGRLVVWSLLKAASR